MFLRLFFLSLLFVIVFSFLCAASEDTFLFVDINETGRVVNYYDEYYIVNVNGTFDIRNNYNSTHYNVKIPFDIGTLNIFETSSTDYIGDDEIRFYKFLPFESKSFTYQIRGIIATNPVVNNESVLRSSINLDRSEVEPILISRLQKADIEKFDVDTTDMQSVKNRRAISLMLENPTDITYNISSVNVLKTPDQNLDEDNILDKWVFPENKSVLVFEPHSRWNDYVMDYNASPGEVYWLRTKVDSEPLIYINDYHDLNIFRQDEIDTPENITEKEFEDLVNRTDYLDHMMYAQKSYSNTHLNPGDTVDVDIKINNFAPINRNITIEDYIPAGFEIVSEDIPAKDSPQNISWKKNINPNSILRVRYQLKYVEEGMLGLDYFKPAIVRYGDKMIYTGRTSFIHRYIPEKKLFIQKHVKGSGNGKYRVEIILKNIGKGRLENLYVKEFLDGEDVFSEITKEPEERGLWLISEIDGGDKWKVSYVTDENRNLYSLPQVLGIDEELVLKTLIAENYITEEWLVTEMALMEKIGIIAVLGAVLTLAVLIRYKKRKKEWTFRRFQKQIDKLKSDTAPSASVSIDYLKNASRIESKGDDAKEGSGDINSGGDNAGASKKSGKKKSSSYEDYLRKEAHENIDHLKELHEDVERKS